MKSIPLPPAQATRLARVRRGLEIGNALPGAFHGKRFRSARHLISIPLGRRWRAIFEKLPTGYQFRDCLSHERYNKINPGAY
jgi:hypothetical protein